MCEFSLLHSPKRVALGPSVGYDPGEMRHNLQNSLASALMIGWSKYKLGDASVAMNTGTT